MTDKPILQPGRNCWRVEHADRVALLVDGEAYFRAVRNAIAHAECSLMIIGWDIDSRLRLIRDEANDNLPTELGDFIDAILSQHRQLHASILCWDFAMIYSIEREWLPVFRLNWRSHRRMRFKLDNHHPVGASQHQKIVAIDDRIAFCGGFDLTHSRWDTPAHKPGDSRRTDPDGKGYAPFHDVQMLVEGDAAKALGELARERWRRAGGKPPPGKKGTAQENWPDDVTPDFEDVQIAIARTYPEFESQDEVREVERLYLDCIAAAERSLYIENQYLTSNVIVKALAERLASASGPEIVIVLPRETSGWLEQHTMDVLRARVLRELHDADRHQRLQIMHPDLKGLDESCITVHAKLMVVDDRLLRVGSANLSNRSMGFDSECDLAIEATSDQQRHNIAAVRNRLLAEHLGTKPESVAAAIEKHGSLIQAIESLSGGDRTLRVLHAEVDEEVDRLVPDAALLDPEKPIDADKLANEFVGEEHAEPARKSITIVIGVLVLALSLAAAWRWTPLREWLDPESLRAAARFVEQSAWAPLIVFGGFVVGSLAVVPVTLMIIVTVLVFGPVLGVVYALVGAGMGGIAGYGLGQMLGRDVVRRFAGSRLNSLSRRLAKRGVLTVAAARLLPVAPFTVVNMVAGASHIGFRDFAIGNVIGLMPGTIATAVFIDSVVAAIRKPQTLELVVVAVIVAVILAGGWALRRWLRKLSGTAGAEKSGA